MPLRCEAKTERSQDIVSCKTTDEALLALVRLLARSAACADFDGTHNERFKANDKTINTTTPDCEGGLQSIADVREDSAA